jgi:hypothetical protein
MILPIHLLPDTLNLEWGMSKERCLTQLNATPLKESPNYVIVKLSIQASPHEVGLQFDKGGGLWRIEVNLYVSRDFWSDYTSDEMDRAIAEYKDHYERLREYCISVMGPPDFSGSWGTSGYPEDQTSGHITYWNHARGRMQIELEHPDKEYPIFVRSACYLVPKSRPK